VVPEYLSRSRPGAAYDYGWSGRQVFGPTFSRAGRSILGGMNLLQILSTVVILGGVVITALIAIIPTVVDR
jgi:hypothetical protein